MRTVRDLALEDKLGQLLVCGFPSDSADDPAIIRAIEQLHAGNIILFARNLKDREQIARLTQGLQARILEKTGVPALIAVDQEGGMVTRVTHGGTFVPGAMAIGATWNPESAYTIGSILGREMRALGMNMNLAPVVECGTETRLYSDNPFMVAAFGARFAKGLQDAGVIATLKHFPGYTNVQNAGWDPHFFCEGADLSPLYKHSKTSEFIFKSVLSASGADAIMAGHTVAPAYGSGTRGGCSAREVVTGVLRERMGFGGLVITDCLEMASMLKSLGAHTGPVETVRAGCELLCISHTFAAQESAYLALRQAVERGHLTMDTLDERVSAILAMKEKHGIEADTQKSIEERLSKVNFDQNAQDARRISEGSVTLLHDVGGLLPLPRGGGVFISPKPIVTNMLDERFRDDLSFAGRAAKALDGKAITLSSLWPDEQQRAEIVRACEGARYVVLGVYGASAHHEQVALLNAIQAVNHNVVVVALRSPADYAVCGHAPCMLCAYEYTPLSLDSVCHVLTGELAPEGVLPIAIDRYIRPDIRL